MGGIRATHECSGNRTVPVEKSSANLLIYDTTFEGAAEGRLNLFPASRRGRSLNFYLENPGPAPDIPPPRAEDPSKDK